MVATLAQLTAFLTLQCHRNDGLLKPIFLPLKCCLVFFLEWTLRWAFPNFLMYFSLRKVMFQNSSSSVIRWNFFALVLISVVWPAAHCCLCLANPTSHSWEYAPLCFVRSHSYQSVFTLHSAFSGVLFFFTYILQVYYSSGYVQPPYVLS